MTDLQRIKFYFPAWNACCRARGWTTRFNVHSALFDPALPWPASPLGRELLAKVFACAQQLGLRNVSALDCLRHACHIVALGKNKSSKDLNNDDTQRVVDLFRVLADPDNLTAVAHWTDPTLSKKENLIAAVKHKAPYAYWSKIARDRFHTSDLESLQIWQLNQLCMTLNNRKEAWRRPVEQKATKRTKPSFSSFASVNESNCPF